MKKRLLSALLSAVMIASVLPAVPASAAFVAGDIDNDGQITAGDARKTLRASVNLEVLTPEEFAAADVEKDDKITAADARKILRASVNLESLHTHDYVKHEVIKKANCKEKGSEKLICECGEYIIKEIPVDSDNHTGGTSVKNKTEATCTKEGYTGDTVCNDCGKIIAKGEIIPVNPDNHTGGTSVKNKTVSTCVKEGYTGDTVCNDCGKIIAKGKVIPKAPDNHSGGTSVINKKAATCTTEGYTGDTICNGCKKIVAKGKIIAKDSDKHTGKTYIENKKAATCKDEGYTGDTICSSCGKVIAQGKIIPRNPDNHTGKTYIKNKKTATCINTGYTGDTYCKDCGKIIAKGKVIAKDSSNHTGETFIKNKKAATCINTGYTGDTYCKDCGKIIAKGKVIAKDSSNHTGGTSVINKKAATCKDKGYTGDTICNGCKKVIKKGAAITVNPENHAGGTSVINKKAATCKDKGYTGDTICNGCKKVIKKGAAIPVNPKTHTGETYIKNEKPATCIDKGYSGDTYCKGCNKLLEKGKETEINPENHVGGTKTADIPATCISQGHKGAVICKSCEAVLTPGTIIPVDENAHLKVEISVKPTCTTDGYKGTECKYCHQVWDKVITGKATGHNWGPDETVKATCTTDGYTFHTCTVCKAVETLSIEKATGHKLTEIKKVASTCEKKGYKESKCSVCGEIIKEELPLTTHTPYLKTVQEADCYHPEIKQLTCSVCGEALDNPIIGEKSHKMKAIKGTKTDATCTKAGTEDMVCRICGYKETIVRAEPLGHDAQEDVSRRIEPTCTTDGKAFYNGVCKRCGEELGNKEIILPKLGHKYNKNAFATCTEAVTCERCGDIIIPALGHDTLIKDSALGRDINGLICRRCNKVVEKPVESFNAIANILKDPAYTKNHNVKTFSKTSMNTIYTRFDFGIFTEQIKELYEDEMANTPDEFSAVRTGETWQWMPINPISVSLLSESDVDSIKVDKIKGIKMNEVLSKFPNEFTSRKTVYNISDEKNRNINEDVIKITIDVKNETLSGADSLGENKSTALQKIYNFDIRDEKRGYKKNEKGELVMQESETGPGYNISMDMKLKEIYSDALVTYYFTADNYEPIAAVYDVSIKYNQSIDMNFSIGLFTLHGIIDPEIKTSYTNVYLFKNK